MNIFPYFYVNLSLLKNDKGLADGPRPVADLVLEMLTLLGCSMGIV